MMRLIAILFLAAAPSSAQPAAKFAMLVNEEKLVAADVSAHVASDDPLTRATAARLVMVRGVAEALPALRDAVVKEKDAEAAREQVRALALLGTPEDAALAAKQLARFPASIDSDFVDAVSRRGAPGATSLYIAHRPSLRDAVPSVSHALWGRSTLATATLAQLLGAGDVRAFGSMLDALLAANIDADAGVLTAALKATTHGIANEAVWYAVRRYAAEPTNAPEVATTSREGASVEEEFGREIVRRMRGAEMKERPEWLAWMRTTAGRARVPYEKAVRRHLTFNEQQALQDERLAKLPSAPTATSEPAAPPVEPPPFALTILLPAGLGGQILEASGCTAGWLGLGTATVDRTGRVQGVDVARVETTAGCRKALATMLRLSLADPTTITSPLTAPGLQLVRAEDERCFDEGPLAAEPLEFLRIGGDVKAPVVVRRVEPDYPESAQAKVREQLVIAEFLLSKTGCVRAVRLLKQSAAPELNRSTLTALAKWKFKPATLHGRPVDAIFNATVFFRR